MTLVEQEEIPALGHAWEITGSGYPATCTTPGKTDKTKCTKCGKIENAVEIPATGHTEVVIPGKDATCTEPGLTEGKYCSVCDEVIAQQTEIPATDHTPGDPVKEKAAAPYYEMAVYCATCNEELSRESFNDYTVTLWGTAYTIQDTEPTEYYWVNGAEGEVPVAATADDNWNYSYALIDGIPTVTLRNATYNGTSSFLSATFNGKLKLAYEGTNSIVVPYTSGTTKRSFVSYAGASSQKGHLVIAGAEGAVLNVTGGDNSASMLGLSNKACLTISGGTVNIEKTNAGGSYAVIGAAYAKTVIENCTLNVKNANATGDKHPVVTVGGSGSGTVTITNAKVNIQANTHIALCVGVFQSNMNGVVYASSLKINGNSDVKVVNTMTTGDKTYSKVGIYASTLAVNGGSLEVQGANQAVYLTTSNAVPNLSAYVGSYEMYTAVDGEAVTEYTATTYFKVKYLCPHTSTTTTEQIVDSTCTVAGTKTTTVTCDECGSVISEEIVELPLADHAESIVPGKDATCTETGLTDGKVCAACGEVLKEQTEIPMIDHVAGEPVKENVVEVTETQDGSYDLVERCADCGVELSREPIIVPAEPIVPDESTEPDDTEPGAALPSEYVLKMADHNGTTLTDYKLTNYDTPVYSVNTTFSGYYRGSDYSNSLTENKRSYVTQREGTADNWNAKLIWHTGDEGPTLYLDGFKIDTYNDEMGGWLKRSKDLDFFHAVFSTGANAPLKIVLQGEDSYVRNYMGIHYQNMLTIESEGDAKLTMVTYASGISPCNTSGSPYGYSEANGRLHINGFPLVLNANLDVSVKSKQVWGGIVTASQADLIINGGNININSYTNGPTAMKIRSSGNLIVNGGTVTVNSGYRGIIIPKEQKVYVNGGTFAVQAEFYALYASNSDSPGATDVIVPVLPENADCKLYQGSSSSSATEVSALTGDKMYIKVVMCDHIEEIVPGKAATCTQVGYTEGKICTVCGKRTVLRKEIPATGHTEVILPSQEMTCTKPGLSEGKMCSVCGEILVEQVVTPAPGHIYDGVTDIDCNTCGAIRPTITVEGNKVSVHLNGVASAKTHTFYVEGKNVADINNWNELKATGTLYTYSAYEFTLKKAGDYVLRLEYYDSEGTREVVSYPITIENTDDASEPACKPEFTVKDNIVTVKYNGATNMKVHAFYVEGKEVADINYWSALKAADPNFQTYSKNIIPLTKVGRYILRAEYYDTEGNKCIESFEVNVTCVPVSVSVAQQNVTVNIDGATNVKVHAFFVEEGESVDNIYEWSQLMAVDPDFKSYTTETFRLSKVGRYVLRVQYIDSHGNNKVVSYMAITSLIVPEIVNIGNNKVKVDTNGLTVKKIHAYYVEGQDIADINDWRELSAEAVSYKAYPAAYAENSITLKNSGTYVIRIEFVDRTGANRIVSQLINIPS